MKILAMYLPQFHRVKENDQWWGTGFTEWTAVKGAKKLYKGHYQPRIPKNGNYYDLLDKSTMQWQAKLMQKYGVDGACIYHYWFKDGRKILEKPAENLLKWKDIDMPYCFCWANETWARTWGNLKNRNVWMDTSESENVNDTNCVLLEQKYGGERQWRQHFEYLVPFFKDERYIKIDGKPLFMIYRVSDIPCLIEMLECWRNWVVEYGLKGIYIIGAQCKYNKERCIDAEICLEPSHSFGLLPQTYKEDIRVFNYDAVWQKILDASFKKNMYFQGNVGYDDTPRRGGKGCLIDGGSPDKFARYLTELMAKSYVNGNELVFVNAWNEWGEGMHLEPDERYGEEFLSAITYAKNNYSFFIKKYKKMKLDREKNLNSELNNLKEELDKDRYYLKVLDQWMMLRENNFSIETWLIRAGCKKIALYGYSILGRHFHKELLGGEVTIQYVIDRQGNKLRLELPVYLPEDSVPKVDAVIVASTYYYDEIRQFLRKKGIGRIISLETILYEN